MVAAAAATATTLSLNLQGSGTSAPNAPNPLSLLLGAAMGAAAAGRGPTAGAANGHSGPMSGSSSSNNAGNNDGRASPSIGLGHQHSSGPNTPQDGPQGHSRRTRTQLSAFQVAVLSALYLLHKCPSVPECGVLGDELGLPGRVVQVPHVTLHQMY